MEEIPLRFCYNPSLVVREMLKGAGTSLSMCGFAQVWEGAFTGDTDLMDPTELRETGGAR